VDGEAFVHDDGLKVEEFGSVVRVTLNRPRAMNALNGEMVTALNGVLDRFEAQDDLRVLLVTGNGDAFCAGADLKEALGTKSAPGEPDFLTRASDMLNRLRNCSKPVIASLNGITMAGGLELAMCADIIVAADSATISDAHANYGVYPGAGGAAILPRLIPLNAALYMLLTGKSLPASRLLELGLVAEIHPVSELDEKVLALAGRIAAKSPAALRRMKAVARTSADKSAADALLYEQTMLREHLQSDDLKEGLAAFAERRPPVFVGR